MKQEWEEALKRNTRYGPLWTVCRRTRRCHSSLRSAPKSLSRTGAEDLQKFDRICCEIEEWDADDSDERSQNVVKLSDWT